VTLTPVEREQVKQIRRLADLAGKLADFALDKLTELLGQALGRPVSRQEALEFLESHPELLTFQLLDEAIAANVRAKIIVNTALRLVGAIVRHNDGWSQELKQKRGALLLQMVHTYRPDLFELLKDKPNLMEFLAAYLLYKMGV